MKNMNLKETSTVKEMASTMEETVEKAFDKEKAYQYFLQLSTKMNFWGEGLHKNEEWSF